ncbi:hypothetical protein Aduo_012467 [Ancylostoma duodenale]
MKLLLLALLPLAATFTCPANTMYHQEFSRCYKFSADALPFYMAEEACLNLGGHLISFAGGLENAMVAETAQQQNIGSSFFIGLNKLNGNAWGYTDGQNVSFTNWASGEPSAAFTCAIASSADGIWQSASCSSSYPYVCAISTIVPTVTCPPCPTAGCPAPPGPPSRCQSGWTYFAKTNSCYKYFLWQNFDNAENICKSNGGHLTSIHSKEENVFVSTMAMSGNTYTDSNELTWVGLKQVNYPSSKDWTWTDGTPVDFLAWAPTQPDDSKGQEHCVELYCDHTGKDPAKDENYQRWNDMPCSTNMRSFVCKKASIH